MEEKQEQNNNEDILKKLEEAEKMRDEYLAGWQRQKADFVNYQKDVMRQTQELIKFANEDLISDILIVLDSFDISVASLKNNAPNDLDNKFLKGMELIKMQLEEILKKRGLEVIETIGHKFNPEVHEAIESVVQEGEEDAIIEELARGYKLNGKVIRAAKVKIIKN
jgi:molecular chaperone GrpE